MTIEVKTVHFPGKRNELEELQKFPDYCQRLESGDPAPKLMLLPRLWAQHEVDC